MICPYCKEKIGHLSFKNSFIMCCEHCRYIYSLKGPGHLIAMEYGDPKIIKSTIESKDFDVGSIVICVDPRHKEFLNYGTVLSNDILHVRTKFFDGITIWMDKNTMCKKPEEW